VSPFLSVRGQKQKKAILSAPSVRTYPPSVRPTYRVNCSCPFLSACCPSFCPSFPPLIKRGKGTGWGKGEVMKEINNPGKMVGGGETAQNRLRWNASPPAPHAASPATSPVASLPDTSGDHATTAASPPSGTAELFCQLPGSARWHHIFLPGIQPAQRTHANSTLPQALAKPNERVAKHIYEDNYYDAARH